MKLVTGTDGCGIYMLTTSQWRFAENSTAELLLLIFIICYRLSGGVRKSFQRERYYRHHRSSSLPHETALGLAKSTFDDLAGEGDFIDPGIVKKDLEQLVHGESKFSSIFWDYAILGSCRARPGRPVSASICDPRPRATSARGESIPLRGVNRLNATCASSASQTLVGI
jgi:hypothetical protein